MISFIIYLSKTLTHLKFPYIIYSQNELFKDE